jgi:peptide/nickel transport system ATP-binding protein
MLCVKNLKTEFHVGDKIVRAVDGVSFDVPKNSIVGIAGESGSGKSVTALSIMGLLSGNARISEGAIFWNDENLLEMQESRRRVVRGKEIGLIFQNPLAALNPVFTIGSQLIETICLHQKLSFLDAKAAAIALLTQVNIPDAETRLDDYPHQFSLGMCQRIMIALTLSMNPSLLIADEPTASLDVTIQAQILALIKEIQEKRDMSVLLISHDLGVMAQYCDFIVIMYLGKLVEKGTPKQIFSSPKHPYTQALISAIPSTDPTQPHRPILLKGDIPSPMNVPMGCRFHTRCPHVMPRCLGEEPALVDIEHHWKAACYLYDERSK